MSDKSYWENGKHLWVTSKDMKSHRIRDSRMKISDEALSIMTQYKPGTILIVTRSGILRHSLPIAILERDATINQDLKAISFYTQDLHPYIYYAIKAQESFILKEYHKDGTTVDSINFEKFSEILLPIPPKQEQIRIITTIEKLFGLIEEIDNNKKDLQELTRHTKSIILDMAISGKLVVQDPADKPAADLLQRVNPNAVVSADTSHYKFYIPNNWTISQLGSLFTHNTGKALNRSNREGTMLDYITTSNLYWDRFELEDLKQMPFKDSEIDKCTVIKGDLLVCEGGDIGRSAIWNYDYSICIQNHIHRLRPIDNHLVFPRFYYYCFLLYKHQNLIGGKGIGIQGLSSNQLHKVVFPLPPLNEQKRIVSKVDELFAVIDQIKQSLE